MIHPHYPLYTQHTSSNSVTCSLLALTIFPALNAAGRKYVGGKVDPSKKCIMNVKVTTVGSKARSMFEKFTTPKWVTAIFSFVIRCSALDTCDGSAS